MTQSQPHCFLASQGLDRSTSNRSRPLFVWRHVVGLRIDRHGVHFPLQIWLAADNSPMTWRKGEESDQWLKLSESVSTRIG